MLLYFLFLFILKHIVDSYLVIKKIKNKYSNNNLL